jgi:hypothetical protein
MRMHKLISAGFATCALASASIPALAWTVWPDVDFEWYADVGRTLPGADVEIAPAPRQGYIWAPGHWETRGSQQTWVASRWIKDDYPQQLIAYNNGNGTTTYATGPTILRDSQGNIIPTDPAAYPVDSARR